MTILFISSKDYNVWHVFMNTSNMISRLLITMNVDNDDDYDDNDDDDDDYDDDDDDADDGL